MKIKLLVAAGLASILCGCAAIQEYNNSLSAEHAKRSEADKNVQVVPPLNATDYVYYKSVGKVEARSCIEEQCIKDLKYEAYIRSAQVVTIQKRIAHNECNIIENHTPVKKPCITMQGEAYQRIQK